MMNIKTSNGFYFQVSEQDAEIALQYRWYKSALGYIVTSKNNKKPFLHRLIMGIAPDASRPFVDHINGNKLDNRRENLRWASRSENNRNSKNKGDRPFKGVVHNRGLYWVAQIRLDGKNTHIGTFDSEIEAAKAYDAAAKKHFGDFARLNFPEEP